MNQRELQITSQTSVVSASAKTKTRRPSLEDAAELLSFFQTLVKVDCNRVERPEDVTEITLENERNWIEKLIKKHEKGDAAALCVFDEAELLVGLGEVERRPRWIERHVAELRFGLFPERFDQGLFLVRALEKDAVAMGIEVLYYFHLRTQTQGLRIMEASGYRRVGVISRYYKKGTTYIDRIIVEKHFNVEKSQTNS